MTGLSITRRLLGWRPVAVFVGLALVAGACTQPAAQQEASAATQEVAALKTQLASVQTQFAAAQPAAAYWGQLTSLLEPVTMPAMSDHRAHMTQDGTVVALHFDNMDLSKAQNLNWVAVGVPGKFCKSDQERVEKVLGKGVTHFHDMMADTHGGAPGANGVWFVHVAVREFDAPWGHVKPGVDMNFMPTAAPQC